MTNYNRGFGLSLQLWAAVLIVFAGPLADWSAWSDSSNKVVRVDVEKMFGEYPVKVAVNRGTETKEGWATYELRPVGHTNAFMLALRIVPEGVGASKEFLRERVKDSTGGSPLSFQIGDEAVVFGSNRFLVRRGNVIFTLLSKDAMSSDELKSLTTFTDQILRTRGTGVVVDP